MRKARYAWVVLDLINVSEREIKGNNMRIKPQLCLLAASLLSASFASSAGDEPVDCRNEQMMVDFYEGYASCYVSTPSGPVKIGRYVSATPSRTALISESVNGAWASCSANVPYVGQRLVYKEVCKYKPSAFLTIDNFSTGEVYLAARGADRDGTFTVQLFVDGELLSGTSAYLNAFTGKYTLGQHIFVEAVVTDNDGYVSKRSGWAVFEDLGVINPPGF